MSFTPSKYQAAIFEWIKTAKPGQNLIVKAFAGSGKTKTMEEMMKLIPSDKSILALAFNSHIAKELQSRVDKLGLMNVQASTLNSFGWKVCRANVKGLSQVNQYKTFDIIDQMIVDDEKRKKFKGPLSRLMSLKKACPSLSAEEIVKRFDLETPTDEDFMPTAGEVWKKIINMTSVMDFDDQIFMPIIKKWKLPLFDYVLVDEGQDLSEVQIKMIQQIGKIIVVVGDEFQAIYGFRGAMPDAIDQIQTSLKAEILPLSICYRCPKNVVKEAQTIVPAIEYSETAEDGIVETCETKDFIERAKDGDWVLCRTTAPLVKRCLQFISSGRKATVKGRDIGKAIEQLIDKVNKFGDLTPLTQFGPMLRDYYMQEAERLEELGREAQLESLEDKVNCIEAMSEGSRTVADIKSKITKVFSDFESPGVTFATAHRSKGLEEDNIFIIRPDLMPFPKAKAEWQRKQEMNLKYVAITRAKKRLTWVKPEPEEVKRVAR
jgi:DNA helicase-2/ATP-dependent DNA helicase PcrA